MKKYVINLQEQYDGEFLPAILFECDADDADHAIEQADEAYPECKINAFQFGYKLLTHEQITALESAIELCGGYDNVRDYIDQTNAEISIVWGVEDVIAQAEESGIEITDDQAYKLLTHMKRNHDAESGINWDVIDCYLQNMHHI